MKKQQRIKDLGLDSIVAVHLNSDQHEVPNAPLGVGRVDQIECEQAILGILGRGIRAHFV